MAGKGNGKPHRGGGEHDGSPTGSGAQLPFSPPVRGLDGGLAKACPSTEALTQRSCRSFRRRLELFERQCHRRSVEAAVEGALLLISRLNDLAWDVTEAMDFTALESSSTPFKPIYAILDGIYQYQHEVELPARCDEFFTEFSRLKNEETQAYLVRHRTMMTKMNEVKVQIPNLLAGWHLMTRAGVPKWTYVQIKALCQGELEYEKVQKALMKMFGGDHKPNTKDLRTGGKDETFYEEEWEAYDDDEAYEMTEEYEWPEEEAYEAEEDEEWPEELDEAYDQCDEAYISYLESRRRMRELALSRGFYPVVAIPPDDNGGGRSSWKGGGGKNKGKGKSKSKSKGKGKGKGSGSGIRRTFDNRRPMSGLRRPTTLSSSTGSTESPKSIDWIHCNTRPSLQTIPCAS